MSEMIERVRDAIYDAAAGDPNCSGVSDRLAVLLARAAIEAMREPTEAMLGEWDYGLEIWQSMIDEALK